MTTHSTGSGVDADEVNDDMCDDDEDDDDAPGISAPSLTPAARSQARVRLVLESGNRRVEACIDLDGNPDAAAQAHDRLREMLVAEGYKEG